VKIELNALVESSLLFDTYSTPCVVLGWIYFQGTDNKLWRISDNGELFKMPYQTDFSPFVDGGYIYFRGTDAALWKVDTNPSTGFKGVRLGGLGDWILSH
jgi:hypothetical protein